MLAPESSKQNFINYEPYEMTTPFDKEEIEKVACKLKSNKSTGIDEIKAEQIKYSPENVFETPHTTPQQRQENTQKN